MLPVRYVGIVTKVEFQLFKIVQSQTVCRIAHQSFVPQHSPGSAVVIDDHKNDGQRTINYQCYRKLSPASDKNMLSFMVTFQKSQTEKICPYSKMEMAIKAIECIF